MENEIDKLLNELKNMKSETKNSPQNSKELWNKIGSGESWEDMGFESEDEMKQFILSNPYSNI